MASTMTRRITLSSACLLVSLASPAAGAGSDAVPKPNTAEPTTIPAGPYLQNLTSNSVTIMWADRTLCEGSVAYGESKDTLDKHLPAKVMNPQDKKPWNGYQQEVTIDGLAPGRTYHYRVTSKPAAGGKAVSSVLSSFATPPAGEKSFTFAVIADTHAYKNAPDVASRLSDEQPHLILLAGDYNKAQAGLFQPYRSVLQRIPIYFARGNHDSVAKQQQFVAMPGPGKDLYYSFRRGNALFISVDTNDHRKGLKKGGAQYQWLDSELKNSKDTWKFVFQHFPIYSAYGGKMDPRLDEVRQLFEKYNVDVVFQGHMHNYDRSYPLRGRKVVAPGKGVVYITASGACGGYEKFPHPHRLWFIAKQWRGEPFVGLCTVNDKHATIQFVTAKGLLFDSLELRAK